MSVRFWRIAKKRFCEAHSPNVKKVNGIRSELDSTFALAVLVDVTLAKFGRKFWPTETLTDPLC